MRNELVSLEAAMERWRAAPTSILSDQPNRRRVVRTGGVVIKAYSSTQRAAWDRELHALQSLAGSGIAPGLVDFGPGWLVIDWIEDATEPGADLEQDGLHERLGRALAALHRHPPSGMRPWPIAERLTSRLAARPPACPETLFNAASSMALTWVDAARTGYFVHGDWGTSNVLVEARDSLEIAAVIDLEDAHVGDPAEDFKWQVLAGPRSPELAAMVAGYRDAGGPLDEGAAERIGLFGLELCLDVLSWDLGDPATTRRFAARCLDTLEQLVDGVRPVTP